MIRAEGEEVGYGDDETFELELEQCRRGIPRAREKHTCMMMTDDAYLL